MRNDERAQTAVHEAGHAFVNYWHFLRMGLCAGVSLTMNPSEQAGFESAFGLCRTREKLCADWTWNWWASGSAAGSVAEGLWAVEVGYVPPRGSGKPWTWKLWVERASEHIAGRIDELEEHGADSLDTVELGDDLESWWLLGRENGFSVTAEDYWHGWLEAEEQIRDSWDVVSELAHRLYEKKSLSEQEVLAICEKAR